MKTMIEETTLNALRLNVKLERERYQPKGGMCCTCSKLHNLCNALHFEDMPVICTTAEGQSIVRCTEHVRSNAKVSGAGTASAGLPGYTAGDNTE